MHNSQTKINPFIGLRAFKENERHLFYGRTTHVHQIIEKLTTKTNAENNRLLAVIGSAECGKSSLINAGIIPALYGFAPGGIKWRTTVITPGINPINNLAKGLAKPGILYDTKTNVNVDIEAIIESKLRLSDTGLAKAFKHAKLPEDEHLLIIVDQFEELYRFHKYEKELNNGISDATAFVNLLLAATKKIHCPVYIIIAIRSVVECAQFNGLAEAINSGQYLLPKHTRDEIKECIKKPVALGRAEIEDRLVSRLLSDYDKTGNSLPLLQHALMRTWDKWQKRNEPNAPLSLSDYENAIGEKGSISEHANEFYPELISDKQRTICELLFKSLTDTTSDSRVKRKPASITELCALTNHGKVDNELLRIKIDDAWQELFKPIVQGEAVQFDESIITANMVLSLYFKAGIYNLTEINYDVKHREVEIIRGVESLFKALNEKESAHFKINKDGISKVVLKQAYLAYQTRASEAELSKMDSVIHIRSFDFLKPSAKTSTEKNSKSLFEIDKVSNDLIQSEIELNYETLSQRINCANTILDLYFSAGIFKLTEITEDATQKLGSQLKGFFPLIKQEYLVKQLSIAYLKWKKLEPVETIRQISLQAIIEKQEQEVIGVIEIFRKEGRNFLMPLPEIILKGNSIIDLSSDSLIPNWDKLKRWNDEVIKNAEIYKRLSEDARLHYQKISQRSLWRNPELAYGLQWYEAQKNKLNALWGKRKDGNYTKAIAFLFKSKKANRDRKRKYLLAFFLLLCALLYPAFKLVKKIYAPQIYIADSNWNQLQKYDKALIRKKSKTIATWLIQPIYIDTNQVVSAPKNDSTYVIPIPFYFPKQRRNVVDSTITTILGDSVPMPIGYQYYLSKIRNNSANDSLLLAYSFFVDTIRVALNNNIPENRFATQRDVYANLYRLLKINYKDDFNEEVFGVSKEKKYDDLKPNTLLDKKYEVKIENDEKELVLTKINSGEKVAVITKAGFRFICFAIDSIDNRVYVSATDNSIITYKLKGGKLEKSSELMLGNYPATALYCSNGKLFFGDLNGRTGYIAVNNSKYSYDKMPRLSGKITSIQLIERQKQYGSIFNNNNVKTNYLFVTSVFGKSAIYEMNQAGDNIVGIELPDRQDNISIAKYFDDTDCIYFYSDVSKKVFKWNPFEDKLMALMEQKINWSYSDYKTLLDSERVYILKTKPPKWKYYRNGKLKKAN